jgi:glycosyltransferase involved in cell wall biosynthesis
MNIAVSYCGTWSDPSGYGAANRNFITALWAAGVETKTELVTQTSERAEGSWVSALCNALKDRKIEYKIKFIHLTADLIPKYMEHGKYHIYHCFWETDKLPKPWIEPMNMVNEIWTASEKQAGMIKKSGVTVPIHWFPQPIDTSHLGQPYNSYRIPNFEGLIFLSIFQWIERKNPKALLQTYWKTFTEKTNVALVLKTYRITYLPNEIEIIKQEIQKWKTELNLPHYPKVFLVKNLMNISDIFKLHFTGDCFVTTTRGEGWQIPVAEAALMGKPVIAIDKTGIFDYLPKDIYYSCNTSESQVTEVSYIPWYEKSQKWLDINQEDLGGHMLSVYNDRSLAINKGIKIQKYVRENFNYHTIGTQMKNRLEQIYKFL